MKALLAVILTLGISPQEKIEIKFNPKAGDTLTSEAKTTFDFKATRAARKVEVKLTARARWTREILETSDGGVTKCVLDVKEDTLDRPDPISGEMGTRIETLHKKKATLSYVDGKKVVEGEGLDDEIKKLMPIEYEWRAMFPSKPVGVGESWEVDRSHYYDDNEDMKVDMAKVTLTLKETKEIDGKKCAVLRTVEKFKCKIVHHSPEPIVLEITLGGETIVRLDGGYVLSRKLKGRAKYAGDDLDALGIELSGNFVCDFTAKVTEGK